MVHKLKLLTYNVMIPVVPPIRHYGQYERAEKVSLILDRYKGLDVVVLNEVIPKRIEKTILPKLEQAGFHSTSDTIQHAFTPVAGGVFIASPHEILERDTRRYGDACSGSDCLSAKGISYAKIRKRNFVFHVFATHLQAWPGIEREHIRHAQLDILKSFVDSKSIPYDEPVILMGDLNMDLYTEKADLDYALDHLNMGLPERHEDSHMFTVDRENNVLVGADDPGMYKNPEYPDGCMKEYFDTLTCPCCPSVWLDYVLYSKSHLTPQSSFIRSDIQKVDPFLVRLNNSKHEIRDVSDHYPVYSELVFPKLKKGRGFRGGKLNVLPSDTFMNSIGAVIILFVIGLVSFLLFHAKRSWWARLSLFLLALSVVSYWVI